MGIMYKQGTVDFFFFYQPVTLCFIWKHLKKCLSLIKHLILHVCASLNSHFNQIAQKAYSHLPLNCVNICFVYSDFIISTSASSAATNKQGRWMQFCFRCLLNVFQKGSWLLRIICKTSLLSTVSQ